MSYFVREIKEKSGMDDFLSLPSEIYRNDPNHIVPQLSEIKRVLNPLKNPYFTNASLNIYVCYSLGKPVCRAVMVINRLHWQKWKRKSAFFGFFESVDDSDAASYLFRKIESYARASGAEYLEGPFNPNHYSELGILLDNFNSAPIFFESYNPPYYSVLLKEAGFSELCKFHTRINNNFSDTLVKKIKDSHRPSGKNDITIRKFNIFRFKRDLEILREINNDAFENNWYFLPLSRKEYLFSAKFLFFVTNPGLILIAEYKGQAVGAVQCVINFNCLIKSLNGRIRPWNIPGLLLRKRNIKELIIFTGAVKKSFRNTRVSALLFRNMLRIFRNCTSLATTWISDENLGAHLDKLFELRPDKHFAIFSKQL
jgi:hypothetical protein